MKEILKLLRDKNRYSQAQIAELLGVSRQAYIKYESGEVEPSVEIVRKLSDLYSVSYEDLIDDKIAVQEGSNIKSDISNVRKVSYQIRHEEEGCLKVAEPAVVQPMSFFNSDSFFEIFQSSNFLESLSVFKLEELKKKIEKIISVKENTFKRELGGLEKDFWIAEDFDETPDVFNDYLS